jgi:aspartate/methionine/tyrosine aminotransferase
MSNILLAKPQLSSDWIDTSVGEAHIIKDNLLNIFNILPYHLSEVNKMWEYHEPQGYKKLIQLLEIKYKSPVIITNGAKNALGACFYALQQMGKKTVGMRNPYWALIPPLLHMHGLSWSSVFPETDAHLLLAPNNPDGWTPDNKTLQTMAEWSKEENIPFIHDAVYYNHIYLPQTYPLKQIGDVQIYSASKSLGLSGLRLGWVVCPNVEFYKLILQYMEHMTVGVSIVSQVFLYDLLNRMHGYPTLTEKFELASAAAINNSKKIVKQIDPEILEVPADIEDIPGMFLWAKVGPKADFQKAKVNVIDGELFGMPGFIRMNLASDEKTMLDIVQRLNSIKET